MPFWHALGFKYLQLWGRRQNTTILNKAFTSICADRRTVHPQEKQQCKALELTSYGVLGATLLQSSQRIQYLVFYFKYFLVVLYKTTKNEPMYLLETLNTPKFLLAKSMILQNPIFLATNFHSQYMYIQRNACFIPYNSEIASVLSYLITMSN